MTELFGTLFPLNNILSHIKLIPPLGRDFIMQKTLIHCCWVHLARALMEPPCFSAGAAGLGKTKHPWQRQWDAAWATTKRGFVHWSGEKRCCWSQKKKTQSENQRMVKKAQIRTRVPTLLTEKCIAINGVRAFIRRRGPGTTDLLYSTISEGHLWPPDEKPQLIWWA